MVGGWWLGLGRGEGGEGAVWPPWPQGLRRAPYGRPRLGLPVLSMVAGPVQAFFGLPFLMLGGIRYPMDLCARKGFRGGPFLDVFGTLQLLNSDHVREER